MAGFLISQLAGESRDSGLSDNHSRQSSEPSSSSSDDQTMAEISGSGMLMSETRGGGSMNAYAVNDDDDSRIQSLEERIREQEVSGVALHIHQFIHSFSLSLSRD